ncbi:tRNA-splicing endonuclease subunit [Triplophysa tibetana]|uniref:tRNA-splicing endonuclease subunit Sen2 n=1 Tax=Triplophysa tibetana TaxID=1572043 RepID=A0A5A9NFP4_9TELE|nr:tRNA-splicing endonuclease subunit [Triplophysa tibetana]
MTEAVFQAPKRRAKIYESFEAPLPIREDEDHIIYRADIINHHVIVKHPLHIQALYDRGYFGKGVFSRSRPEHRISQQWKCIGDRYHPVITSSEYQKRVSWARAALLMQGLDDDAVSHALRTLTKPVELDIGGEHDPEPVKSQAGHLDGSSVDHLMDCTSGDADLNDENADVVQADTVKPQRQGNSRFDPLAELCPDEPEALTEENEQSRVNVKCQRHDDWIIHCGCRAHDNQSLSSKHRAPGEDPSEGYEYVLVEKADDDHENGTKDKVSCDVCGGLELRINPFSMMEYLQLTYEEAFFLVYALGCLSVYYSGEPLSILEAWSMFRSVQPNFSITYAAYHYFRAKGWVPKTGVKYGTDLMLYRKGPPFYHASYSVVVDRADDSFAGSALRPFTWRSLAALSRITGNVSKELMLCYVITPSDTTEDMFSSPECLKRLTVQEVIVSRWVSSKERTEQDEL